jgi:murein DD-endopeptidase MepM/ murein hydrolase activator NlpD
MEINFGGFFSSPPKIYIRDYSANRHGKHIYSSNPHTEIDIEPEDKSDLTVYSPFDGTFTYNHNDPDGCGYYTVVLYSEDKYIRVVLCHMKEEDWSPNNNSHIIKGQPIATMSNSGNAVYKNRRTGKITRMDPHLHIKIQFRDEDGYYDRKALTSSFTANDFFDLFFNKRYRYSDRYTNTSTGTGQLKEEDALTYGLAFLGTVLAMIL